MMNATREKIRAILSGIDAEGVSNLGGAAVSEAHRVIVGDVEASDVLSSYGMRDLRLILERPATREEARIVRDVAALYVADRAELLAATTMTDTAFSEAYC